jgi:hypothetical protein
MSEELGFTEDNNLTFNRSRIMNDDEVYGILAQMTFREKIKAMSISKQFSDCVNHMLSSQKNLIIKVCLLTNREKSEADIVIKESVIREANRRRDLNMNDIKEKYEITFRKLETLNCVELILETINKEFGEWIVNIFPQIEKIKITVSGSFRWTENKLRIIKNYFETKTQSLSILNYPKTLHLNRQKMYEMSSLKTIEIGLCHETLFTAEVVRNLPRKISSFKFCGSFEAHNNIMNSLVNGNGKYLKALSISIHDRTDGNQVLLRVCKKITQLKKFRLLCDSLVSLEFLSQAKNLKYLVIGVYNESLIKISIENYEISTKLQRLKVKGNYRLMPNTIEYIEESFPNIKTLIFEDFGIECICSEVKRDCFVCYKNFLKISTKVSENLSKKKKSFTINLRYKKCQLFYKIVLMSILGEYLDSKNSYKLSVNKPEDGELRNYLLDIGIILAYMRPNIVVKFKIDSTLCEDLNNYKDIIPSNLKLDIVDNNYEIENEILGSNEFVVLFESSLQIISIQFGKRNSLMKRMFLSL